MKRSAIFLLAGLSGAAGLATYAFADGTTATPPGSYRLSCYGASVANDALSATCQTLQGNYQAASLGNLSQCENAVMKGGDIGNIDGSLVCIPNLPQATSEPFPQSETTINQWVYGGNSDAINRHGWSIWAGLTSFTGSVNGTPVRAFETWTSPGNMIFRIQSGLGVDALRGQVMLQKAQLLRPARRFELDPPRQFRNLKPKLKASQATQVNDGDTNILVSVAYNPAAAQHAITNKLFLQSTLNTYLEQGYNQIPVFPAAAITTKPVFKVIQKNEANGNVTNGIYTMPGWPGTPSPAVTFPESSWNACVYIDLNGTQSGNSIDQGCQGRTPASTFQLSDFIHYTLNAAEAADASSDLGIPVSAGDIAILVGMHVTSREATRWTWQTFWWSANDSQPYLPSSATIAAARPAVLDRAAAHYAMAVAYQMVSPAQPIMGGKSVGAPVYAYNPHLEAGFDPSVFQTTATINDNGQTITNQYGVQTNCMSCHGQSMYQSTPGYYAGNNAGNRETPYAADYYFGLNDPMFNNKLQLDFAWSVLGSLVLDDDKGMANAGSKPKKTMKARRQGK
ncbi:hypothetical protein [Lysobacter fragariae]